MGTPVLPATVLASHLQSCAAGLAADTGPGRAAVSVGDVHSLANVIGQLIAAQQHISATLLQLASYAADGHLFGAATVTEPADVVALVEVLRAAGSAAGHSAGALAESGPLVENLVESAGG